MRWDDMSMSQKSEAIGLMVRNGVTDIGTMKQMWDDMDGRKKPQQPPFAKRFEENPPRTIPTSQGNASHFMAADEADGRYFAYPTVQPTNYKDKKSPLKYYGDRALNRALENSDVLEFPTLDEAIRYSENYKRPPSTGAYLNNEFHPLYSPYDYVRSFAEGGSPDEPPVLKQSEAPFKYHDKKKEERLKRLYSISANIMNFGKEFSGEDSMGWEDPFDGEWTGLSQNEYSTPYRIANNGVAQATFLMPRKQQAEIFRRTGYTEHPNDFGLVRKAVVKDCRDIPVWQSKPDSAKRDDLIYLGYTLDEDSEAQRYLEDPGVMPTAYYVDSKSGNAFFKGWDLNDYDVSNGNHRQYNFIQRLGANIINRIGSPVVVTTGFQPTEVYYLPSEIKEEMYNQHHLIPTLELIAPEDFSSYDEYKSVKNKLPKWSLPEVRIGLE